MYAALLEILGVFHIMNESDVQAFWQNHPCGEMQVGGLEKYRANYTKFFEEYDKFRYRNEGHILKCLDEIDFESKHTLEIGLGEGADSEQIIRRGAIWSGVDLTEESVRRVQTRMELKNLKYSAIKQGSALELPFDDNSFDIIFSHGVLHHVPDINRAQQEIWRILKPGGKLIVMLYAKYSLNYLLSISIIRRLGLALLYAIRYNPGGIYGQHLVNARKQGLVDYLKIDNFIHHNTDGPLNPYAKVYDLKTVRRDFLNFKISKHFKQFMHAPPLSVRWLPLERAVGWHLWVYLEPVSKPG